MKKIEQSRATPEQLAALQSTLDKMPCIKTCSCGETYTKLTWKLLDFVGYFDDDAPADPEHPEYGEPKGRCEQRNCVCGSTIMMPLNELEEP